MLPGRDGLSILKSLRERGVAIPVLILTARSELNERVQGLNASADDYLTKLHFDTGSNMVDVAVGCLRRKIETSAGKPLIETVRGAGYRFKRENGT